MNLIFNVISPETYMTTHFHATLTLLTTFLRTKFHSISNLVFRTFISIEKGCLLEISFLLLSDKSSIGLKLREFARQSICSFLHFQGIRP